MSRVIIEKAKPEDAEAILTLKRDAWLERYVSAEHGVTEQQVRANFEDVHGHINPEAIERWQHGIASDPGSNERCTFVARLDGQVVGAVAPHRIDGKKRLGMMYVHPDFYGRGIGGLMIKKAIEYWGREEDIYLHVLSYNDKAIGFYEHYGFKLTGVEFPPEGATNMPELEMVLAAL